MCKIGVERHLVFLRQAEQTEATQTEATAQQSLSAEATAQKSTSDDGNQLSVEADDGVLVDGVDAEADDDGVLVDGVDAEADDDGVLVDDVDAEAGVRVLVDHVEEGREGRAACMLRSVVRVDTISGLPADVSPPEATSSS